MQEKQRIKNLSTRYLTFYKLFVWLLLLGFFVYSVHRVIESPSTTILVFAAWLFPVYKVYQMNRKLFQVEFDDEFLYIIQRKQDMLVPLENIKDIELKTMIGHWEVTFYNAEQLGDKIYFKPSLLYPFNSKTKDKLVDELWANIEKAKRKKQDLQRNALRS